MKRKFSKILGVGLTLALLASLLVTGSPVMAGNPTIALTDGGTTGIDGVTGDPTGSGTEAGEHSIALTDATASTLTGAVAESGTDAGTMLTGLAGTEVLTVTIAGELVTTDPLELATIDVTTLVVVAADIEAKINAATTIADVTVVATDTAGVSNDMFVITVVLAGVNNSLSAVTGDGATPTHLGGETPVAGTDAEAVDTFTAAPAGSNGLWVEDENYGNGTNTMTITHSPAAGTASTLAFVTAADAFIEGINLDASGGLSAGTAVVTVSAGTAGYLAVTGTEVMDAGVENELTVTAYDSAGNVASSYDGEMPLTFSGPSVAPDGTVPTVEAIDIGEEQTVTFALGVADGVNLTLIAYVAEATTVDVSDGTVDSFADPAYDLDLFVEGTSLDKAFYMIGDDVAVTVCDASANVDPIRTDEVDVEATSDTDAVGITVTLSETGGVNTGIFTGTFPLVAADPEPGPGELAVADGNTITVVAVVVPVVPDATATVDMSAPEFAADTTADAPFYNNEDTITLTVTLDDVGYTITADFSSIDSEYTAAGVAVADNSDNTYTVTYTIAVANTMVDGDYTIPVAAEDAAGNPAVDAGFTTSVLVGLDNTAPEVTEPTANPAVIQPDDPTDVTFTANVSDGEGFSGVATVTVDLSSIGKAPDQAMLDDGASGDEEEGDGIYGYICAGLSITDEDTYELTITATDDVGNVNDTEVITLRVLLDVNPPVIVSTQVEYPVGAVSARVGDPVVITAVVTDDLAGVATVTVDATDIGLGATEPMSLVAGTTDTYRTVELVVGAEVDAGTYTLPITATDLAELPDEDEATVDVEVVISLTGYNINLVEGWNLVSLPLIPDVAAIGPMLASIADNVDVVWGYDPVNSPDDPWATYVPGLIEDDLTDMVDGMGYWVYMTDSVILTVTGVELPEPNGVPTTPPAYDVATGWNLIGVKDVALEGITLVNYLGNIAEDYSVIWGYDTETGYFNVFPIGTIDLFPGLGYWLWMKVDGIIVPSQ